MNIDKNLIKHWAILCEDENSNSIKEDISFKNYFGSSINPDMSDEDMDNWFEDFCKDASGQRLEFEKYMCEVMANNVVVGDGKRQIIDTCKQYLDSEKKSLELRKKICKLCGQYEIFDEPSDEHVQKNGGTYYGGISRN